MMRQLPAALAAAALLLSGPAGATKAYQHKEVAARIALMQSSREAVILLSSMTSGQIRFSSTEANTARRTILRNLRKLPRSFRKERLEPLSNARPAIWQDQNSFKALAKAAEKAARQVKPNTQESLRATLPGLMRACLACHDRFRDSPREFTTH
jgi:cytochrome c556